MTNLIKQQGFAPTTFTEAKQFAEELASSNLVPKQYVGKPLDVLVAMQWGAELGLAPMQSLQNIAVINSKPSIYGDAMMALVQASPVCEDMQEYFEGEGTPNPVAVCVASRKNRKPVVAKFSVEDAKKAGLWGKQGPWTQYPRRMLQMRARGFALRDAFSDVLKGLITAEEAADYPEETKPRERDVTPAKPANPLDSIAPPAENQSVDEIEIEIEDDPAPLVVDIWPLMVPGKDEPHAVHQDQSGWSAAYELLAETIAKSNKILARDKMTKLRELREVNQQNFERMDVLDTFPHKQKYQDRLRFLATQKDPGSEPGDANAN